MWEKELLFLATATAIILVVLCMILLYLVGRKALENRFKRKIELEKKRYQSLLLSYLMDGGNPKDLEPITQEGIIAIEELLSKFTEIIEGDMEKSNLYHIAETYLADFYRSRLRSRNWSKRMNALYHIEDFKIRSLENEVKRLLGLQAVTKDEKVHALRILAIFQFDHLFDELVIKHPTLSEYEYRSILFNSNDQTLDGFVLGFYKCQIALKNAILDILGIKNQFSYCPFIESVFQSNSGEIRLRALKALASIGYVKDISNYFILCKSTKWQERMMLAKLLGAVKVDEGLTYLEDMLHDSTWWVRYQAGQSIKRYPNGNNLLKNVYETTSDSYAKDMAWEWMNRGE